MTPDQKKKIFEYCRWETNCREWDCHPSCEGCNIHHPLNGNDILEAVNIIEQKGDLFKFHIFAMEGLYKQVDYKQSTFTGYLLQNFFELMSNWLSNEIPQYITDKQKVNFFGDNIKQAAKVLSKDKQSLRELANRFLINGNKK